MFTRKNADKDNEKQRQVERFYILLRTLMDELFEYAPKSGHVKMPFNVSFGLIHDQRDSILLSGIEQKTGKKMYLYNVRIIGQMFEDKREQMIADKTADTLFSWIGDVCSLYVRPFVYDYVVNTQHRGKGAADRTTRQIVRDFLNKLVNDPELKYVLNTIKG
ncbi:MAG: hypothetical protein WBE34_00490 [Candidatus Nitrosopolaris sp.]